MEEVENLVSQLQAESQNDNVDFTKVKVICFELIRRLPIPMHFLDNTFLLRSRPNYNGEIFRNVRDLSYNPFPDKIEANRFNFRGEQVFYAAAPTNSRNSDGALTTICESFKALFDEDFAINTQYLTIGRWQIIKPLKLAMLTFYDPAWQRSDELQRINPYFSEFMGYSCSEEDNKKCHTFFRFISEMAGKRYDNPGNYFLTTAFYHSLKEYYGTDIGILYSSSMTDNCGLNIILPKDVIDSGYLKLDHVVMYKAVRNPSNPKSFEIFPCSTPCNVEESGLFRIQGII